MMRSVFIYTLLMALLFTGCSAATPEAVKTNLPALDGNWKITLAHSGGIMGLSRSIAISADGKYTVTDERANKSIMGQLTNDELSKLKEQVASSKYFAANKLDGAGCADCFIYDFEIQASGQKFIVQLNDISLPNSGLESLVSYLRGLIDTKLK